MRFTQKTRAAWVEGNVNRARDHLEIRYGEGRVPVALIAQRMRGGFTVQFLLKADHTSQRTSRILNDVYKELTFYLLDVMGPDSWPFVQYHCTTPANRRSIVHWSWHPSPTDGNHA